MEPKKKSSCGTLFTISFSPVAALAPNEHGTSRKEEFQVLQEILAFAVGRLTAGFSAPVSIDRVAAVIDINLSYLQLIISRQCSCRY